MAVGSGSGDDSVAVKVSRGESGSTETFEFGAVGSLRPVTPGTGAVVPSTPIARLASADGSGERHALRRVLTKISINNFVLRPIPIPLSSLKSLQPPPVFTLPDDKVCIIHTDYGNIAVWEFGVTGR